MPLRGPHIPGSKTSRAAWTTASTTPAASLSTPSSCDLRSAVSPTSPSTRSARPLAALTFCSGSWARRSTRRARRTGGRAHGRRPRRPRDHANPRRRPQSPRQRQAQASHPASDPKPRPIADPDSTSPPSAEDRPRRAGPGRTQVARPRRCPTRASRSATDSAAVSPPSGGESDTRISRALGRGPDPPGARPAAAARTRWDGRRPRLGRSRCPGHRTSGWPPVITSTNRSSARATALDVADPAGGDHVERLPRRRPVGRSDSPIEARDNGWSDRRICRLGAPRATVASRSRETDALWTHQTVVPDGGRRTAAMPEPVSTQGGWRLGEGRRQRIDPYLDMSKQGCGVCWTSPEQREHDRRKTDTDANGMFEVVDRFTFVLLRNGRTASAHLGGQLDGRTIGPPSSPLDMAPAICHLGPSNDWTTK